MTFHVGQKVVCVRDGWFQGSNEFDIGLPCPLSMGTVYTVTGLKESYGTGPYGVSKYPMLLLAEAAHHVSGCGFAASRFRPAVTRKTNIEIFKAMLNPSPTRETV